MKLFFDTETTGKIVDWKRPVDTSNNFPSIVQIGYAAYTDYGQQILTCNKLIKPAGWEISEEAEQVHGISQQMCEQEGILIKDALTSFLAIANYSNEIIAHNYDFDSKVIASTLLKTGAKYTPERFFKKPFTCTMKSSVDYCELPNQNGYSDFKWPKLEELYQILFNKTFEGAHDALVDVIACAECYFELKRLNVI